MPCRGGTTESALESSAALFTLGARTGKRRWRVGEVRGEVNSTLLCIMKMTPRSVVDKRHICPSKRAIMVKLASRSMEDDFWSIRVTSSCSSYAVGVENCGHWRMRGRMRHRHHPSSSYSSALTGRANARQLCRPRRLHMEFTMPGRQHHQPDGMRQSGRLSIEPGFCSEC